jgi:hypothetical protein
MPHHLVLSIAGKRSARRKNQRQVRALLIAREGAGAQGRCRNILIGKHDFDQLIERSKELY